MGVSSEIRRLTAKWEAGQNWPQRLEWIELHGLRGWTGQRFHLRYPIMAVVGENGVGKSSVLQAAASVYRLPDRKGKYATDFFPDTFWEKTNDAAIRYSFKQGAKSNGERSLRKPTTRWRGNPQRPKRNVEYIDLSRIQPVAARVGYTKLVKSHHEEISATLFEKYRLDRMSQVMGRSYSLAKLALTNSDARRKVPVFGQHGASYSGFHGGAGETTVAELLQTDPPPYSIVLIDEVESSLHPRTQRRLIRDLAERCREREWQVILTTHSAYVLAELPPEARAYIMQVGPSGRREIIYGVSPEFAMSRMDDYPEPECDLYVEDARAQILLTEILITQDPVLVQRCQIIPYGAASVGFMLGQMVEHRRWPRPTCVFIDGDQPRTAGCINLPGDDAPERVIFEALKAREWRGLAERVGRPHANVADECSKAMALNDHHEWTNQAASKLLVGGGILWQAMAALWATECFPTEEAKKVTQPVTDALLGITAPIPAVASMPMKLPEREAEVGPIAPSSSSPISQGSLFAQFPPVGRESE
jgi:predicted ATPase